MTTSFPTTSAPSPSRSGPRSERTIGQDNYLMKGRFLYGSTGGIPATDEEDGDFRWRHNLSDRLFTQSDTTYDSDKIKLIHYQVDENVGLGYKIFKTVRQVVDVGAGITGEDLDATGVEKGFTYLGNVFQDYTYKINGRYTFLEDISADYSPETRGLSGDVPDTIIPASGSQRDYAYKFHATLQGKISSRLSLNLHFEYEYDNAVANPTARGPCSGSRRPSATDSRPFRLLRALGRFTPCGFATFALALAFGLAAFRFAASRFTGRLLGPG